MPIYNTIPRQNAEWKSLLGIGVMVRIGLVISSLLLHTRKWAPWLRMIHSVHSAAVYLKKSEKYRPKNDKAGRKSNLNY